MKRNRRVSKFLKEEDTDPLSVVVNLFDVAMVFAVALMVAMVMHMNMTEVFGQEDFTIVKNPGKENMEIISKEGKKINTYKPSGQKEEDSGKRGKKVGIAYELDNGEITYVPEYLSYYVLRKNSLSYQDLMVLPLSVMNQILDVLKRIYNWIEIQHAESEYYLECLKISIRERYIKFLWDVLLLGNAEDFKMLLSWYCRDKEKYISMKLSLPFKYKIWSWAVFPVWCRYDALFVLRPYIQYKRKVKMQKLKA